MLANTWSQTTTWTQRTARDGGPAGYRAQASAARTDCELNMPNAAPKPCSQCGALVHDGSTRCVAHKVKAGSFADSRRGSRHERGYGAAWVKVRARVLRQAGGLCQCAECQATGRVRLATEVDHITSKAEWRRLHGTLAGVDADSNLQAINAECHRRKTQAEAGRGGARSPAPPALGTDHEGPPAWAGCPGV
jgi:5-methylcytosine-specific restriction enzyme A